MRESSVVTYLIRSVLRKGENQWTTGCQISGHFLTHCSYGYSNPLEINVLLHLNMDWLQAPHQKAYDVTRF